MPGKWDGKSRISNDKYRQNFDRIFKTNPIAKEVRTPKYKSRVVKPKKGKGSFKRVKLDNFDKFNEFDQEIYQNLAYNLPTSVEVTRNVRSTDN